MALNKGYLTAKTDKASDEVYTPSFAVEPIIKHIPKILKKFGVLLMIVRVNM